MIIFMKSLKIVLIKEYENKKTYYTCCIFNNNQLLFTGNKNGHALLLS